MDFKKCKIAKKQNHEKIKTNKIMRKLTQEQKQMMDRAIKFAPARQIFMLVWWEIFCHRKADKLIKCVEVGMTWFAAYTIAKNVR